MPAKTIQTVMAKLGAAGLVFLLASCNQPTAPADPPCPPENYDACYAEKSAQFVTRAGGREKPDYAFRAFDEACTRGDADGCFGLGAILSGVEHLETMISEDVHEAHPVDQEASRNAYEKSCSLSSAMGCAAFGQALFDQMGPDFENADAQDRADALAAYRRSCELGMIVTCDAYLYQSSRMNPETWIEGQKAFYLSHAKVASITCEKGDPWSCYSQAIALMNAASVGGRDEVEYEKGVQLLRQTCKSGHGDSCQTIIDLSLTP